MRCRAVFFIVLFLLISFSAYAFSFSFYADALSLGTLFSSGKGGRIGSQFHIFQDLRLDFGLGFHTSNTEKLSLQIFETTVSLDYFPLYPLGFYTGVSIVHFCYLTGLDCPASPFINLLDIRIGYVFYIKKLVLDLCLSFCEPGASFGSDAEILQSNFYQFKKLNLMFLIGYRF